MNPPPTDQPSRVDDPHGPCDLLTDEQRGFAFLIGTILAELWERRQRPRSAPTGTRLERGGTTVDADGEPRPV